MAKARATAGRTTRANIWRLRLGLPMPSWSTGIDAPAGPGVRVHTGIGRDRFNTRSKAEKADFSLPFGASGGVASGTLHRRDAMRANALIVPLFLLASAQASAQNLIRNNEVLESDRPEAW